MKKLNLWLPVMLLGVYLSSGVAYASKEVFGYTGTDQVFTVPAGVNEIKVKAWGAAGGGGDICFENCGGGGSGAYVEETLNVQEGDELAVVVGAGGAYRYEDRAGFPLDLYGGGGDSASGSQGGGLSGVFTGPAPMTFDVAGQARALLVAGGGGGQGADFANGGRAGDAGHPSGENSGIPASPCVTGYNHGNAGGGTQTEGGHISTETEFCSNLAGAFPVETLVEPTPGSALRGGNSNTTATLNSGTGGGGGGGYYGGGGGGGSYFQAGGGGGSSYSLSGNAIYMAGVDGAAPKTDDPDYAAGVAAVSGGAEPGGHGLVVIEWEGVEVEGDGDDEDFVCHDDCEHTLEDFSELACVHLICTADSPAEFTATLIINGETFEKTKVCDKTPPTCTATFNNPDLWRSSQDFPIECELESYVDTIGDVGGGNDGGGNNVAKEVFEYTGDDQTFTVPEGVTEITIKAWGGGASGQLNPGGAGGYSSGTIQVTPGEEFSIMVGQGGDMSEDFTALPQTYGFGGETHNMNRAGQGGGLSGVFLGTEAISATSQSRAVVVAGGGGGGDDPVQAGIAGTPGNQPNSANPDSNGDPGLYQVAFQAAGGGGYLGGTQSQGGTGFVIDTATNNEILTGNGITPPKQDDQDYVDGIAVGIEEDVDGSDAVAGNGLVVISWENEEGGGTGTTVPGGGTVFVSIDFDKLISDTCTSTKVSDTEVKTVCEYTGQDQQIEAPLGATEAVVKTWGGGASGQLNPGGAGGYSSGTIQVTPGEKFAVMVGQGGDMSEGWTALPQSYGFGGATYSGNRSGQGAGLSGVFTGVEPITAISQARAVVVAGGGGGGDSTLGDNPGTPGNQANSDNPDSNGTSDIQNEFLGAGGGGYLGGDRSQGGTGFVVDTATNEEILIGNGETPPKQDDPDYIDGMAVGIAETTDGTDDVAGDGFVVIRWIGDFENLNEGSGGGNGQCLLEPGTVTVIDPLERIHGDTCTIEVCDKSGNCSTCESPELKYDDTDVCTAGTGLGKSADGVCGPCDPDDDDCLCIKGDTSRCRDGGPVNCYTDPFNDRCPGFQNPACLIDPFTPGCPVVNPCYPTPVYDGLNCPRDAVRFCARNPYHYGCNLACADGGMACDPAPPGQ